MTTLWASFCGPGTTFLENPDVGPAEVPPQVILTVPEISNPMVISTRLPDNFKDNVQRCKNGKVLLYIQSLDPAKPASIKISAPLFEDVVVTID